MDFSLIIVNYQTIDITINCLESIFQHCHGESFEVIVIDNASQDNSQAILEEKFAGKIKLIKNKTNLGFARANNQGANSAQGRYFFFLNSDTIIENNILAISKEILLKDRKIGALAPQLITSTGQEQLSAYGKYPQIKDLIINKLPKTKKVETAEHLRTDWLSGAAIIIPKEVFIRVGGWDEKFFMYFEDIDICQRIKKLGYSIIVDRSIKLVHLSGQSLTKNKKRRQYYYQSQNYYFQKHQGRGALLVLKVIRWPYQLLRHFEK